MSTQQRAIATRDQLLDTAEEAFAHNGYDSTGVAEICTAAGVSKGAFYHHFPTKRALFLALLNRWLAALDSSLQSIRANAGNPVEAIEQISQLLRPIFKDGRAQTPSLLVFEFWSQARHEPAVWQLAIDPYRRYRAFVADILRNGIASGAFRPVEADLAAQMLVSLVIGLLLQGMMDPDGADWGDVLYNSMREFLANLTAVSSAALDASAGLTLARSIPAPALAAPPANEPKKKKKKSKHKH
jgi:AcrR family transcriptional regulator